MEEGSLLDLVHLLVENLMLNAHYNADALRGRIDGARVVIGEVAAAYDDPPPEGGEAIRELMLEALGLFDGALLEIAAFIDDADEERLRVAVRDAEEAHDVLLAVDDLVQTQKAIISEMVEA